MIIILGGKNNSKGILTDFTINRIEAALKIIKKQNIKVILSGGYRFSSVSHCTIVKKYLIDRYSSINIEKEFTENNNTVDEAINIGSYLLEQQYHGNITIITSPWHLPRVKYLFDVVFSRNKSINLNYITYQSNAEMKLFNKEEEIKLKQLKETPFGKWKIYINKFTI